jgi:hypothetical protein
MTFLRGTWTVGPFKRIWLADIACMILVPVICEERKLGEEMEPLSRCPPNFRWALYWAQKLHNTTYISFINSSIWLLLGFVILSPVGRNLHSKWIVSLNFLQNVRLSFTDIFQFFLLKCSITSPTWSGTNGSHCWPIENPLKLHLHPLTLTRCFVYSGYE